MKLFLCFFHVVCEKVEDVSDWGRIWTAGKQVGCAVRFLFYMPVGLIGCNTHYAAAGGNVLSAVIAVCKFSMTFRLGSVFCLCSFGVSVLMNEDKVFRSTSQYVFHL